MLADTMTFWQWVGAAIIAGLSGGVGLKLIGWLKEHLDRKARKISYHAKILLEQADRVCGIARALLAVARCQPDRDRLLPQAGILWSTSSTPELLNVWLANAWVLDRRGHLRQLRTRFEGAVEQLRLIAIRWNDEYSRLISGESVPANSTQSTGAGTVLLTGYRNRQWPSQDEFDKVFAPVGEAFEAFLREFQALHNALQPLVLEYISRPEAIGDQK